MTSEKTILGLHKKYAPTSSSFELIYTHSQIVADLVEQLAPQSWTPDKLAWVKTAAMLHDIGGYGFFDPKADLDIKNYVQHGVLGYDILMAEGYREDICRVASRHTGVGLTKQDVIDQQLPLSVRDYLPENVEERLVAYADKFHSKTDPPKFMSFEAYRRHVAKFGADKVVKFDALAREFGVPNLDSLSKRYGHPIRPT